MKKKTVIEINLVDMKNSSNGSYAQDTHFQAE